MGRAKSARYHDLRMGQIPGYVDQERLSENSIILAPALPSTLRQVCLANRANRPTQRAMKKDAQLEADWTKPKYSKTLPMGRYQRRWRLFWGLR